MVIIVTVVVRYIFFRELTLLFLPQNFLRYKELISRNGHETNSEFCSSKTFGNKVLFRKKQNNIFIFLYYLYTLKIILWEIAALHF